MTNSLKSGSQVWILFCLSLTAQWHRLPLKLHQHWESSSCSAALNEPAGSSCSSEIYRNERKDCKRASRFGLWLPKWWSAFGFLPLVNFAARKPDSNHRVPVWSNQNQSKSNQWKIKHKHNYRVSLLALQEKKMYLKSPWRAFSKLSRANWMCWMLGCRLIYGCEPFGPAKRSNYTVRTPCQLRSNDSE